MSNNLSSKNGCPGTTQIDLFNLSQSSIYIFKPSYSETCGSSSISGQVIYNTRSLAVSKRIIFHISAPAARHFSQLLQCFLWPTLCCLANKDYIFSNEHELTFFISFLLLNSESVL